MSVDPRISLTIVQKELQECQKDAARFKWVISEIDERNQLFTIKMTSPSDGEEFIVEMKFDNYKEWPLLIEFIDSKNGERGTKRAYPSEQGNYGNLFHGYPCICHPCSRKAYQGYGDVHKEWDLTNWQQNSQVGLLKTIPAISRAIYARISNPNIYKGRMHA